MKTIIDYIRSCFCKHNYELVKEVHVFDADHPFSHPIGIKWVYRCKKCCHHKIVKDY